MHNEKEIEKKKGWMRKIDRSGYGISKPGTQGVQPRRTDENRLPREGSLREGNAKEKKCPRTFP